MNPFAAIEHGAIKAWHVIELIGHDIEMVFVDTLKAAQFLGIDKEHLLTAIASHVTAVKLYTTDTMPHLEASAIAVLQHEFTASTLVQKLGLAAPISHVIAGVVGKLFATGSTKLPSLIDHAVAFVEAQAGLTPVAVPVVSPTPSPAS